MELTVQNIYGLLLRSKLLGVDEARSMFARWQTEAGAAATEVPRFLAWIAANRYVTEYQAGLLGKGHADGFFLNEYRILDRLGKGRMAGVYKAQHHLGQVVAIKVLPPSKAKDATLLGRFQREAKLAMKLRHPNIVRSFQVGISGNLNYLVMEHLEGETLEEVLARKKQFAPAEGVRLIYQALKGLQHIHEQGLVHRDLKPSNLMLTPAPKDNTLKCTLKILDIGLGRVLFDEGDARDDPGLTGEGVLLGTPDYMAPEQARDPRAADIRADIYSLGCVLYHLLAGQPPFPDTNIISQMIRHATEPPRPVRNLNPAVPEGLEQILGWMLAKEASGRYPTPDRAAGALEVFLAAESAPLSSPDLDPDMRSYLVWLETENKKGGPPPSGVIQTVPMVNVPPPVPGKPPSSTIPTAPPNLPSARPVAAEKQERSARSEEARRKKKARRSRAEVALPPQSADAPPMVEVELVKMPRSKEEPPILGSLTRRDFLAFGAGVGSTLLAILMGWLLAALFSKKKEPEPQEED